MSLRDAVAQEVQQLDEPLLPQLAQYLAFLRFQSRKKPAEEIDETVFAALCAEFAEEDRGLAEEGIGDYAAMLDAEDKICP